MGTRSPLRTEENLRAVRGTSGVAAAEPGVEGAGQLVGSDGEPVGGPGPPTTAGNWIGDKQLNPYELSRGRAPRAFGEVVVNEGAAASGKLEIGDLTTLRTPDPLRVKIVGLVTFGGLGLGGFLGWALVRATDSRGLSVFSPPPLQLAVVALVGIAAGLLAGRRPARRAARLDVLRAVASE